MEKREDLMSILPYLPVVLRSSSLFWPSQVVEALKALSRGPLHSNVHSGELLFLAISDLRRSLSPQAPDDHHQLHLAPSASDGYALFFDRLMSSAESAKWFKEVVPAMANLLLRLPSLLEAHYHHADNGERDSLSLKTSLRLLESQQPGIVFLSQVHQSGLIEDQSREALEVDFANKYIGGGALHRGCVQEEIRFMIHPELIAGMLFLPSMADNEAIEIVGMERFSNYAGYASSFHFSGDYVDRKDLDSMGRRKTRIIAVDALCRPGKSQYRLESLLREINKAFCGFLDRYKCQQYLRLIQDDVFCGVQLEQDVRGTVGTSGNYLLLHRPPSVPLESNEETYGDQPISISEEKDSQCTDYQDEIGIATGNWGCGAFGGDPELKAIIQWLAASQALRPFISYYTFGVEALQTLDQVSKWILSHEWTVGDLWNMLVDYSCQRFNGETNIGFFRWLLPSL